MGIERGERVEREVQVREELPLSGEEGGREEREKVVREVEGKEGVREGSKVKVEGGERVGRERECVETSEEGEGRRHFSEKVSTQLQMEERVGERRERMREASERIILQTANFQLSIHSTESQLLQTVFVHLP